MSRLGFAAMVALCIPAVVSAQSSGPNMISVTPSAGSEPTTGAAGLCYYAGLAYSKDSLLTVDIPYRKESPEALQKQLLVCSVAKDGSGVTWTTTESGRIQNN